MPAHLSHRDFDTKSPSAALAGAFVFVVLVALLVLVLALLVSLAACTGTPRPMPAPGTNVLPDTPTTAVAENQGVTVYVDGDAWVGHPVDLAVSVTPIWVRVRNETQRPLRLTYQDLALVDTGGMRRTAMAPFSLDAREPAYLMTEAAVAAPHLAPYRFRHDRFYIAPYLHPHVPGVPTWSSAVWYEPVIYDARYPRWEAELPTADMLDAALPEGVLEPGGVVEGFAYFRLVGEVGDAVAFSLHLVDADTGRSFGEVRVAMIYE